MSIEFIVPTWKRPNDLMMILNSLMVQTNPNWKAHVIIDGMTNEYKHVKDMYQDEPRVRFSHIEGPNKDWGHTARNYGLDNATEDWIVMTGDDNYYTPVFVDEFLKYNSVREAIFVYCDLVHNLAFGGYQVIKSIPKKGAIDIGNFMVRKDKIGDLRLNTESYEADGEFVESFLRKNKTFPIKIEKVLYVHN
jgi:glycosyltransferase involved in cell wall biosynthesis